MINRCPQAIAPWPARITKEPQSAPKRREKGRVELQMIDISATATARNRLWRRRRVGMSGRSQWVLTACSLHYSVKNYYVEVGSKNGSSSSSSSSNTEAKIK